jgi:hypothetical protein
MIKVLISKVNYLKETDREACMKFILESRHLYCTHRRFHTVEEMVEALHLTYLMEQ